MRYFLNYTHSAFQTLTLLLGLVLTSCLPTYAPTATQPPTAAPTNKPLPTETPTLLSNRLPTPSLTPAPLTPTLTSTSPLTVSVGYIQMIDSTTGWAEGEVGADRTSRLLHTTDGGMTWQDVSPAPYEKYGLQSFFLNAQHAWVSLSDPSNTDKVWRTEDGGQSWTSLAQTAWGLFRFTDEQHGWKMEASAWGLSFSQFDIHSFSITDDGGQTWEEVNPPPGSGSAFLAFPNAQTAWVIRAGFAKVIEHSPNLDIPFFLETTTDGGQLWQSKKVPPPPGTRQVESGELGGNYLDAGNCGIASPAYSSISLWKLVLMCEEQGWVYTTLNQGQTWIISPLPAGQGGDVQFIDPKLGWLFIKRDRSHSQIYQTLDGGQTWARLKEMEWLGAGLDFIDAQTGWAIACINAYCNPYDPPPLLKTTDGGRTWQELQPIAVPTQAALTAESSTSTPKLTPTSLSTASPPLPTLEQIKMIDQTTGWAEARKTWNSLSVLHTTDGGATWRDVSPLLPESSLPPQAFFLNEQLAWVWEGDGNLWRTQDGGQSWTSLGRGILNATDFWLNDDQRGWGIAADFPFHQDILSFSTTRDGGQTWEAKNPPPGSGEAFLAFPSAQIGWVIRADIDTGLMVPFSLETTMDGGQTWASRKIPSPPGATLFTYEQDQTYIDAGYCNFESPAYSSTLI